MLNYQTIFFLKIETWEFLGWYIVELCCLWISWGIPAEGPLHWNKLAFTGSLSSKYKSITLEAYQKFVKIISKGFCHRLLQQYCCVNHAFFKQSNSSTTNIGEACCPRACQHGCFFKRLLHFIVKWQAREPLTGASSHFQESVPRTFRALEQCSDKLISKDLGTQMGVYSIPFKGKIQLRHVIKELNTILK